MNVSEAPSWASPTNSVTSNSKGHNDDVDDEEECLAQDEPADTEWKGPDMSADVENNWVTESQSSTSSER